MIDSRKVLAEELTLSAEAQLFPALRSFVLAYSLPEMKADKVFLAGQNRFSRPAGAEDYVLISISGAKQRGTAVEELLVPAERQGEPARLYCSAFMDLCATVSFSGATDIAWKRAQQCAMLAASSMGIGYLSAWGVSCLHAEECKDMSFINEHGKLESCWGVSLRLGLAECVSACVPYFTQTRISRVEKVEAHHAA